MSQTVGQRIRHTRGTRGVGEFAELLGVNRKTITRWESDEALPDGGSLLALKEIFKVDPAWVLTGSGVGSAELLSADEQVLLDGYRALDAATKKRMLAFMMLGGENTTQPSGSTKQVVKAKSGAQAAWGGVFNIETRGKDEQGSKGNKG